MSERMENIVDLIMEDRYEEAEQSILRETVEDKLLKQVGEVSYMNYLLKWEEFFNDYDGYLFGEEWDRAEVLLNKLKVDKFWVTIFMVVPKGTDLRAAKRIMSDKTPQNTVQYKKLADGRILLKFKVLRRYLDKIEQKNKEKAQAVSDQEVNG